MSITVDAKDGTNVFPLTPGMKLPGMNMDYLRRMGNKMVDALVAELDARENIIYKIAEKAIYFLMLAEAEAFHQEDRDNFTKFIGSPELIIEQCIKEINTNGQ